MQADHLFFKVLKKIVHNIFHHSCMHGAIFTLALFAVLSCTQINSLIFHILTYVINVFFTDNKLGQNVAACKQSI